MHGLECPPFRHNNGSAEFIHVVRRRILHRSCRHTLEVKPLAAMSRMESVIARSRGSACPVAAVGLAAGEPQSWMERRVVAAQIVLEIHRLGRPDLSVPNRQDMRGYSPC